MFDSLKRVLYGRTHDSSIKDVQVLAVARGPHVPHRKPVFFNPSSDVLYERFIEECKATLLVWRSEQYAAATELEKKITEYWNIIDAPYLGTAVENEIDRRNRNSIKCPGHIFDVELVRHRADEAVENMAYVDRVKSSDGSVKLVKTSLTVFEGAERMTRTAEVSIIREKGSKVTSRSWVDDKTGFVCTYDRVEVSFYLFEGVVYRIQTRTPSINEYEREYGWYDEDPVTIIPRPTGAFGSEYVVNVSTNLSDLTDDELRKLKCEMAL